MLKYLLKRILIFIPTMLAITLIAFAISLNAPGDPVLNMMTGGPSSSGGMDAELAASEKEYLLKREELGLNLPVFYFALTTFGQTDTLYHIPRMEEREMLTHLTDIYGNWNQISNYYYSFKDLETVTFAVTSNSDLAEHLLEIKNNIITLRREHQAEDIRYYLSRVDSLAGLHPELAGVGQASQTSLAKFETVVTQAEVWKTYTPSFHFYGPNNQYHRWITGILFHFDFGKSYADHREISTIIPERLKWTILINLFAIFLAYSLSVPLGVLAARFKNSLFDKISTTILFILFSLPNFWVATMLIMFLCNPEYFQWFPSNGVQDIMHSTDWPISRRIADWGYHLVLPIFCFTYASLAFLSRQMRTAMLESIGQDYVRTARAKGLREQLVIWKHAFRNSLIPMVTILASIFPGLVGGSIILEQIFTIPGMGLTIIQGINGRDYPLIIAVFTLTGLLTLLGVLIADLLYVLVDPRISYK